MDSTLYVIGSRMDALAAQLQVVASNVANSNSTGFKRLVSTFAATGQGSAVEQGGMSPLWPQLAGVALDVSQGALRSTGRPLDLAIQGGAFFEVETPEGSRYTRKGRLYLSPDGELTDAGGNRFVGDGGPLRIPEGTRRITVKDNGEILADDQSIGRIALVDIPNHASLVPVGSGIYRNDGPQGRPAVDSRLVQGAVEESNVKPVSEMVALIQVTRAYEAAARALRRLDTLSDQLIKTAS